MDPRREFAVDVAARLKAEGFTALWAGGCVRDHLLGKTPKDFDVATNARPEEVRRVFGERRTLAVGESFGVIVVLGPTKAAGQVEVATFRADGAYIDGRRPESVVFSSPEIDAQRRDFTINGMFFDPVDQRLLDFVGGERDLSSGVVRAIGDPHARMEEDKLRMLRAVRFTAHFGFELDPVTAAAVRSMAAQIHVVSVERIAQEARRMLVDSQRHRALELCQQLQLLHEILPELAPTVAVSESWQRLLSMLRLLEAPSFSLAWATLFEPLAEALSATPTDDSHQAAIDAVEQIGRRLKLSNHEIEDAAWILARRNVLSGASRLSDARLKRALAEPLARDLISLMRVRSVAQNLPPEDALFCEEYLRTTPPEALNPPMLLTGTDLIKSGLKPGPRFKEILDAVRDAQLNGEISTHEQALKLGKELNANGQASGG